MYIQCTLNLYQLLHVLRKRLTGKNLFKFLSKTLTFRADLIGYIFDILGGFQNPL